LKLYLPEKFRDQEEDGRGVVDVDVPHDAGNDVEGDGRTNKEEMEENGEGDNMVGATRWQKEAARKKKDRINADTEESQKPMGGEDPGKEEEKSSEDELKVAEKTLSRAERRKKIKEEILLAGEGEGFKGYKRRMW
jgi:hypothetical protein